MSDNQPKHDSTTRRCTACGEPATRKDADGLPLCEGDYQHLVEHWRLEWGCEQMDQELEEHLNGQ